MDVAVLVGADGTCSSRIPQACEQVAVEGGVLLISGLVLERPLGLTPPYVGLSIERWPGSIVLDDISITGYLSGIEVTGTACPKCTLRAEQITVVHRPGENLSVSDAKIRGVWINATLDKIEVIEAKIHLIGVGRFIPIGGENEGLVHVGQNDGLVVDGTAQTVSLSNLDLRLARKAPGDGVSVKGAETISIANANITNFSSALEIEGTQASLETVNIDCYLHGVDVRSESEYDAKWLRIEGCTFVGAFFDSNVGGTVSESAITRSRIGLFASFLSTQGQANVFPYKPIRISSTIISQSSEVGLLLDTSGILDNVAVCDTGTGIDPTMARSGAIVHYPSTIENSRFVNNRPYAIISDDVTVPPSRVDADGVWWGTPDGPIHEFGNETIRTPSELIAGDRPIVRGSIISTPPATLPVGPECSE